MLTRNGQTAVVGTYLFDFRNRSSTKVKEDITGAFVQVGALEAPADAPAPEQFGDILPSIAKHNIVVLCRLRSNRQSHIVALAERVVYQL